MSSEFTAEEIAKCYFDFLNDGEDNWQCRACESILKQKKGKGYTNLASHVQTKHKDYKSALQRGGCFL